jgi:hypothetical protein
MQIHAVLLSSTCHVSWCIQVAFDDDAHGISSHRSNKYCTRRTLHVHTHDVYVSVCVGFCLKVIQDVLTEDDEPPKGHV